MEELMTPCCSTNMTEVGDSVRCRSSWDGVGGGWWIAAEHLWEFCECACVFCSLCLAQTGSFTFCSTAVESYIFIRWFWFVLFTIKIMFQFLIKLPSGWQITQFYLFAKIPHNHNWCLWVSTPTLRAGSCCKKTCPRQRPRKYLLRTTY